MSRASLEASDDLWIDCRDELRGGAFRAAVVGSNQNIGVEFFRVFEQFPLGGFLDIGGKEDRSATADQSQHEAGIIRIVVACRRRPEHIDRYFGSDDGK